MRTLGKQLVGMNGRFHKSWGDFGGLKNQAALDYEVPQLPVPTARTAAWAINCIRAARLDAATYDRIGATYARVEALEPYARGARAVTDIGVISAAVNTPETTSRTTAGRHRLHQHAGGTAPAIRRPRPGEPLRRLPPADSARRHTSCPGAGGALRRYLAGGGALIASHRSLWDPATGDFALPELGVKYLGDSKYRDEYFYPAPGAFPDLPDYAYFLYQRGLSIEALAGRQGAGHLRASVLRPLSGALQLACADAGGPSDRRAVRGRRGRTAYIANPVLQRPMRPMATASTSRWWPS